MEFFAGYGFNKSHSTTYAWVAYQTALPQGELPVALHGGAADDRSRQHRQAGDVPRGMPGPRHSDPAARHQHQRAPVHGGEERRALRAVRGQERGRRGDPLDARRAPGARPDRLALQPVRARRSAAGEQAAAREPRQGRRLRFAGRRRRAGAPRAASSPRSTAPSSTAAGTSATRRRGRTSSSAAAETAATKRPRFRCPRRRPGPRRSSSPSRRRPSAST